MAITRYFLSDFVSIQRQSFFELLETGLIEEFNKRNPITSDKKDLSVRFYPEYYVLTRPDYSPQEAIFQNKSYTSKLYIPTIVTDKTQKMISLKWVYIGNIPLMTKRGHFILNGAARIIVNQILRSPGIYYQQKIYENSNEKMKKTKGSIEDSYKRYYADLICMRGTWLRIEMDKEKNIWAQMKKGPKIPIYWFLLAIGLSEKMIFKSISDSYKLIGNLETTEVHNEKITQVAPFNQENTFNKDSSSPKAQGASNLFSISESNSSSLPAPGHQNQTSFETSSLFFEEDSFRMDSTVPSSLSNQSESSLTLDDAQGPKDSETLLSTKSHLARRISHREASPLGSLPRPEGIDSVPQRGEANESNSRESQGVVLSEVQSQTLSSGKRLLSDSIQEGQSPSQSTKNPEGTSEKKKKKYAYIKNAPEAWQAIYSLLSKSKIKEKNLSILGRKWLYNRFMNPRSYDLGKQGRLAFNRKLGLNISSSQTTLTGLDVLYATDYLIKVEKGIYKTDDIDHLKNRRVRTSGELIQIQIGVGLVRLEKSIRDSLNQTSLMRSNLMKLGTQISTLPRVAPRPAVGSRSNRSDSKQSFDVDPSPKAPPVTKEGKKSLKTSVAAGKSKQKGNDLKHFNTEPTPAILLNTASALVPTGPFGDLGSEKENLTYVSPQSVINNKAFNSAMREFFGTSPLSQFMDQINPLAELTHKRRLSSMGPGGVTRDTATLAIRGIHPTHYGRICPIETPEGKNTGLVNSMTTYARVNPNGIIESPFYKVYKGQVQKNTGMYYFSAEQEEKIKLAAADLSVSSIHFLPKSLIPVRIAEDFTKIYRSKVQFIGISPLQMISIAASLIPFLEHDDANRALMGSNMQRQAVPLIRPERPIVGTGLEARAVSDSGHSLQAKYSGLVTYVSANRIIVYSLVSQ
uniref:DNA-directed RNA polymerase n=1 Tax=Chlamydomonas applanata TaxID=35704 RepID=A0A0S2LPS3_CHLAP|nr:beta subunit of RNA polymerase [Chlamydomonas applanata]